jgi:hypothetical protein
VHRLSHLDLDLLALAHHPHVRPAQLTQKVQRRLGLLAQGQTQGILPAPLPDRFVHVLGDAVEPVRGYCSVDSLVRTLVIVIVNPMLEALASVREGGKRRLLQELPPDGLPEALDLPQGHGVVRRAPHMLHALLA